MKRKKILKIAAVTVLLLVMSGLITAFYLFNMPHRDTQTSKTDLTLKASELVDEFIQDYKSATLKYLEDSGDSKILEVIGTVYNHSKDFRGNSLVLLKSENDLAGVSCSFLISATEEAEKLKIGTKVRIKGVIRSGASYDEFMDLYEHVIMEDCDIIQIF